MFPPPPPRLRRPRPHARDASRQRLPSLADAERAHIVRVLEAVNWNKKQAAGVLEISRFDIN